MNDVSKKTFETISKVADRIANAVRNGDLNVYEGETKLTVMLDLEYVNDVCPLDFDRFLNFDEGDFGHDVTGIYKHFNRDTKKLENCFAPRCSKPEPVGKVGDIEPQDEPGADLGIEVRVVDQEVGYNVVVEFNAHIETYHYDADTPAENGKYFAVENFVESYANLFTVEAVAMALGTQANQVDVHAPIAKPIGTTQGAAFDLSRAINLYLMAARDLGTNLGGYDLVDLLADKTDWNLDKCRRLANAVVSDPAIVSLLITEGVPDDIDPPGVKRTRKRYAGTQFEYDDDDPREIVDSHDIASARGASQDELDAEDL